MLCRILAGRGAQRQAEARRGRQGRAEAGRGLQRCAEAGHGAQRQAGARKLRLSRSRCSRRSTCVDSRAWLLLNATAVFTRSLNPPRRNQHMDTPGDSVAQACFLAKVCTMVCMQTFCAACVRRITARDAVSVDAIRITKVVSK